MATQILVIEDDTQIRENITEMLTLYGFHIETAVNGREGISQALLHSPDLILCDIMMPEVDGYQVLEVVRQNRSIANVPFIFLTAKTEPADLRRGMVLGADDYLTKPFTLQTLLHTIESRLQREAGRQTELKMKLDNYRHSLAAVSVHEYNTALTGIIGFSSLLLEQYQQLSEEDTLLMVKMIKVSGMRLKRSLDNIQLMDVLQQVDPAHAAYKYYYGGSTDMTTQLVASYVQTVEQRHDREVPCQLEVESAPVGLAEANLRICLSELIDNAFKFSDSGQTVLIRGEPDEAGYCFTITNKGKIFKAENSDQIAPYRQFDRQEYEQQGFGLGLSIVKKIIELNLGRLTIESPSPGVTTVAIWLPKVVD